MNMSPVKAAKVGALKAQTKMFEAQTRYYNAMTSKIEKDENEAPTKKPYLSSNYDYDEDINSMLLD